jgi:hypothetical protein
MTLTYQGGALWRQELDPEDIGFIWSRFHDTVSNSSSLAANDAEMRQHQSLLRRERRKTKHFCHQAVEISCSAKGMTAI